MKLDKIVTFSGTIFCVSGLSIGASSNTLEIGGIDREVIKNPITKEPYIPGSSLKGKMRAELEKEYGAYTIIKETTNTKQVDFRKESLKNSIKKQEIEYEKQRKLKKSCYEDWKLGVIDETDYYEYNQSYVKKMQKLEEQILYLKEELMECESLKSNNEWIEKFKKYENITELIIW